MIFGGSTRGMASLALLATLYQSGPTAVVATDRELSVAADANYWAAPEPTLGLECVDDKIYSKDGETVCITEGQAICFDSGTDDDGNGLGNVAFGIKRGRAQVFNNRNQPVSICLYMCFLRFMRYSSCSPYLPNFLQYHSLHSHRSGSSAPASLTSASAKIASCATIATRSTVRTSSSTTKRLTKSSEL